MVKRLSVRLESRDGARPRHAPPQMYDDHLLAWRAELVLRLLRPTKPKPVVTKRQSTGHRKPVEWGKQWWPDTRAAAADLGCSPSLVRHACAGRFGTAKGKRLRYSRHATIEEFRAAQGWRGRERAA